MSCWNRKFLPGSKGYCEHWSPLEPEQQCKGFHPAGCRTCSAASKGRQSPMQK